MGDIPNQRLAWVPIYVNNSTSYDEPHIGATGTNLSLSQSIVSVLKTSYTIDKSHFRPSATVLHGAVRGPDRQQSIVIQEIAAMKVGGLGQRGIGYGGRSKAWLLRGIALRTLLWAQGPMCSQYEET